MKDGRGVATTIYRILRIAKTDTLFLVASLIAGSS